MSDATGTKPESRRTEKIGNVVSTKMQKTIVVQVEMRKTHPKYKRVIKLSKKFYAKLRPRRRCSTHQGKPPVEQAEALDSRRSHSPFLAAASRRNRQPRCLSQGWWIEAGRYGLVGMGFSPYIHNPK
jgi:hypothetical protein